MNATLTHEATAPRATASGSWRTVCRIDDLELLWGEAAVVAGRQIALFRLSDSEVRAVSNQDPVSGANVIARGILGHRGTRPTVASPLFKEVYDLETGECLDDPRLRLGAYPTRVVDGLLEIDTEVVARDSRTDSGLGVRAA